MSLSTITSAGAYGACWPSPADRATKNAELSASATVSRGAATPVASSEDQVTLGATRPDNLVYSKPDPYKFNEIAWAEPVNDDVSMQIEKNMRVTSKWDFTGLLEGVGAKLLNRFATDASNYQQTMVDYEPRYLNPTIEGNSWSYDPRNATLTNNLDALKKAQDANHHLDMKIRTTSGKDVVISISFDASNGPIRSSLNISVQTNGTLTDAERQAIAKLSGGFEKALRGIAYNTNSYLDPNNADKNIDFSGLLEYDKTVLSGIDLSYQDNTSIGGILLSERLNKLDFQADEKQKSISIKTEISQYSVKVDLSRPEQLGTSSQQQAAVQQYLKQIDAANQRAHGVSEMAAQFKSMFAQLHSSSPANNKEIQEIDKSFNVDIPRLNERLNEKDHSTLTGLADFEASMSGKFFEKHKAGKLDYRLDQKTQILGKDKASSLSIIQTQKSSLQAEVTQSRDGAILDVTQGNYDTFRIQDESSQITTIQYAKDKLQLAVVKSQIKQWEEYAKVVNHKVEDKRKTPFENSAQLDISNKLFPSEPKTKRA